MLLTTLKTSAEFRRIRGGARWASPVFVVEGKLRDTTEPGGLPARPRFGFTVTKKLGKATVRNSTPLADEHRGLARFPVHPPTL